MKKLRLGAMMLLAVFLLAGCKAPFKEPPSQKPDTTESQTQPTAATLPETTQPVETTQPTEIIQPIETTPIKQPTEEDLRNWLDRNIPTWTQEPAGQIPNEDPVEAVRSKIENLKNASYAISVSYEMGYVNRIETERLLALYRGSELARGNGWSDSYLNEHFLVVYAEYTAEYDHTKTMEMDGNLAIYAYMVRDSASGLWYWWDGMTQRIS